MLATIPGSIVLVGHSYGGEVITNAATGNPNVKALVYVAAFAPEEGETADELATMFPGSPLRDHHPSASKFKKSAAFNRDHRSRAAERDDGLARRFPSGQQEPGGQ